MPRGPGSLYPSAGPSTSCQSQRMAFPYQPPQHQLPHSSPPSTSSHTPDPQYQLPHSSPPQHQLPHSSPPSTSSHTPDPP
ncbi:hypothetical protein P7K49_032472, partial [Saguinus oedipus]